MIQVIKNSNGCNLAVDIWSLGCTVLEMATTKPPWFQYEGVSNLRQNILPYINLFYPLLKYLFEVFYIYKKLKIILF